MIIEKDTGYIWSNNIGDTRILKCLSIRITSNRYKYPDTQISKWSSNRIRGYLSDSWERITNLFGVDSPLGIIPLFLENTIGISKEKLNDYDRNPSRRLQYVP